MFVGMSSDTPLSFLTYLGDILTSAGVHVSRPISDVSLFLDACTTDVLNLAQRVPHSPSSISHSALRTIVSSVLSKGTEALDRRRNRPLSLLTARSALAVGATTVVLLATAARPFPTARFTPSTIPPLLQPLAALLHEWAQTPPPHWGAAVVSASEAAAVIALRAADMVPLPTHTAVGHAPPGPILPTVPDAARPRAPWPPALRTPYGWAAPLSDGLLWRDVSGAFACGDVALLPLPRPAFRAGGAASSAAAWGGATGAAVGADAVLLLVEVVDLAPERFAVAVRHITSRGRAPLAGGAAVLVPIAALHRVPCWAYGGGGNDGTAAAQRVDADASQRASRVGDGAASSSDSGCGEDADSALGSAHTARAARRPHMATTATVPGRARAQPEAPSWIHEPAYRRLLRGRAWVTASSYNCWAPGQFAIVLGGADDTAGTAWGRRERGAQSSSGSSAVGSSGRNVSTASGSTTTTSAASSDAPPSRSSAGASNADALSSPPRGTSPTAKRIATVHAAAAAREKSPPPRPLPATRATAVATRRVAAHALAALPVDPAPTPAAQGHACDDGVASAALSAVTSVVLAATPSRSPSPSPAATAAASEANLASGAAVHADVATEHPGPAPPPAKRRPPQPQALLVRGDHAAEDETAPPPIERDFATPRAARQGVGVPLPPSPPCSTCMHASLRAPSSTASLGGSASSAAAGLASDGSSSRSSTPTTIGSDASDDDDDDHVGPSALIVAVFNNGGPPSHWLEWDSLVVGARCPVGQPVPIRQLGVVPFMDYGRA